MRGRSPAENLKRKRLDRRSTQDACCACGVLVPDAALEEMGHSGDARMGMQAEARERGPFDVEQVEENEGFEHLAKVARAHQTGDRGLMELHNGTRRFSELRRTLHGISQKMLTTTLRGLERDGFITRTIYPTVPPKVEYRLTELGRELAVPVRALGEWAMQNRDRVLAARERFDLAAETSSATVPEPYRQAVRQGP